MYDRILIPTDGSREAELGAEHGVELAAAIGAEIHALYVIEEGGNPWSSASMADQQDQAREYGEQITGDVGKLAREAGVSFVSAVEVGPAVYEEINDYVEDNDIDLIVMGSGYHGKFGGLLGSTGEKVLRSAEVPVTTVRRMASH